MLNPIGLCQCGCGQRTAIASRTRNDWGYKRGEPVRFIRGHASRGSGLVWSDALWEVRDLGHTTPYWIWLHAHDRLGYGRFKQSLAYRIAYERKYGPVPAGHELDHLCRVPACVNPDHVDPVSHRENIRRGATAKLSYEKAAAIRMLQDSGLTYTEIGLRFGVCKRTIWMVMSGRRW